MKHQKWKMVTPATLVSLAGLFQAQATKPDQASEQLLDSFRIDTTRSQIDFAINHLEFMTVRGAFNEYDAMLHMAGTDWTTLELQATIAAVSIYTGRGILDDNLRSVDFFDVDTYPEITFVSHSIAPHGKDYRVSGHLTMKGITEEVILALTILDTLTDQRGYTGMRFRLSGELNRQIFGVSQGGMPDRLINDIVQLEIQVEAMRQD